MSNRDVAGRASARCIARVIGAAALLAGATQTLADDAAAGYNAFEITPFVGYMFGGEFEDPVDGADRDLDSATNVGVILDYAIESWRQYELLYSMQSTQLEGVAPVDMDVQYLQIGGAVSYEESTRVIPYFGMTVGATHFSPDETGLDDETRLSFSVAGGVRVPITEHIGVRFDARAFVTLLDTDGEIFCVSSAGATCRIQAKSDTFLQYAATLGVIVGF
jgi:Outer membrane protein beta-barrel domain